MEADVTCANQRQTRRRFVGRPQCTPWVTLAVFFLTTLAHAQAREAFALSWTAPGGCPQEDAVRRQVLRLAPAPAARERPLQVQGTVRDVPGGYVLELVLQDGQLVGRRRFESASCSEVVGAAAVAIALLLTGEDGHLGEPTEDSNSKGAGDAGSDTVGAAGASERESTARDEAAASSQAPSDATPGAGNDEEPVAPAAREATESAKEGPKVAAKRQRGRQFVLLAPALSASLGFLSKPSLGVGAGFGFEPGPWRFLASGSYLGELDLRLAGPPDHGVRVRRRIAHLAACRWMGHSRLQLAPCATLAVQYLVAHGAGSDVSVRKADFASIALGPAALARLRVNEWLGLSLGARLLVQTGRPTLVIEGLGEVDEVGPLELGAQLAAEWIF